MPPRHLLYVGTPSPERVTLPPQTGCPPEARRLSERSCRCAAALGMTPPAAAPALRRALTPPLAPRLRRGRATGAVGLPSRDWSNITRDGRRSRRPEEDKCLHRRAASLLVRAASVDASGGSGEDLVVVCRRLQRRRWRRRWGSRLPRRTKSWRGWRWRHRGARMPPATPRAAGWHSVPLSLLCFVCAY